LPIHEIQNNRPLVDQRNLGAEGSHKGCVLEAYDASSHYYDFFRQATQIAKVIGIHNAMVVKGMSGLCAGRVPQAIRILRPLSLIPSPSPPQLPVCEGPE